MNMATIEISREDFEFLRELQHELLTQPNDGCADPVYWGVMETREVGVPDGCGEPIIYMGDGCTMELDDVVHYIEGEYLTDIPDEKREEWESLDKKDMGAVIDFMHEELGWNESRVVYVEKKDSLSEITGAFLTKRACKEYIKKYAYNHAKPHTYAMTAFRNFELEKLLNILKTVKFEQPKLVSILNIEELKKCIAEYQKLFPKTALTLEDVKERLLTGYENDRGNTGLFGFGVSPEWEDKCYSFEFRTDDPVPTYEFMGMYKC